MVVQLYIKARLSWVQIMAGWDMYGWLADGASCFEGGQESNLAVVRTECVLPDGTTRPKGSS